MKYYLAGPMSGYPEHNIPAFRAANIALTKMGYDILLPVDLGNERVWPTNSTWTDYLAEDIKLIEKEADGIIFLPKWWESRGARLEAHVGILTGKSFFMQYHEGYAPSVLTIQSVKERLIASLA